MNRRAGRDYDRIRDLIEVWAAKLPLSAYADLQGRMQSGDDNDFDSAFFELYLHELLVTTGHAATSHPVIRGTSKRPDFLASTPEKADVIVEAKVVTEKSKGERAADARLSALYDAIDQRIQSTDYFISVAFDGSFSTSIPVASWCRDIQSWLDGLN
jgi:hypothetical protein